jgi:hypothetical protein
MNANYNHAEFEELCALAHTETLCADERRKFARHLATCAECSEAYREYQLLATEGMPLLASTHAQPTRATDWDDRSSRKALLARIRRAQKSGLRESEIPTPQGVLSHLWAAATTRPWMRVAIAACVLAIAGYGSYRLGIHQRPAVRYVDVASNGTLNVAAEKQSLDKLIVSQAEKIVVLQQESSKRQSELDSLHSTWRILDDRSKELAAANNRSEQELRSVNAQRDTLSAQLAKAQQGYEDAQQELASIQNERDKALLQVASLESSVDELKAANQDQERRIKDDAQYLAADRDIRELMGARKLYIADVFDVDTVSRTSKPFGRVFYTENKSLIFYAFDLDRQQGVKNATFQVWGEKDAAQGEKAHPLNLGILYMDSESNRRWVLRSDDPKQLAAIDAVFVTVEPHGGSRKPTSKPFLYALLRKEANHP